MRLFEIYFQDKLVGTSDFSKFRDPSMGAAGGRFLPNENYREIRAQCRRCQTEESSLALTLRLNGKIIECGAVVIKDWTDKLEPDCIEVEAIYIPHPLYAELF